MYFCLNDIAQIVHTKAHRVHTLYITYTLKLQSIRPSKLHVLYYLCLFNIDRLEIETLYHQVERLDIPRV